MQAYIGAKVITAEPQEKDGEPGYRVVYADNYASWSPKHVFEEAYRPISDGERDLILGPAEAEEQPEPKGVNQRPPQRVHESNKYYGNPREG